MRVGANLRFALGNKLGIQVWPDRGLLAIFVAVHAILWTLAPAVSHLSVPLDVAEGYGWGREWVIATYKHPNLPGWILEASRLVTARPGWPAYLVSQAFVAATFGFVYLLAREFVDERRAVTSVLLLSRIELLPVP